MILFTPNNNIGVKTKYFAGNYEQEIINGNTRELHYVAGPMGLAAIYVKNNGTDSMYYTHTDHLGSITEITNNTGTLLQRMQYDAWGKRSFITNNIGVNNFLFDRGYTGHEHLDQFSLINMNGRLYDPILGRMLSPDNYVQNATSTQGFNRYSYAVNNPLVYTDPDGEFIGTVLTFLWDLGTTLFTKGGMDPWNTPENRREAWSSFDPTGSWSKTNKAWKIDEGWFKYDNYYSGKGDFWRDTWQIASRFIWEPFGTTAGNIRSHYQNLTGNVEAVHYVNGATVMDVKTAPGHTGQMLGGSYIRVENYVGINYEDQLFYTIDNSNTLVHEYGHYMQSRKYGDFSIFLALNSSNHPNESTDSRAWYEKQAQNFGYDYMKQYYNIKLYNYYPDIYSNDFIIMNINDRYYGHRH